MKCIWLCCLLLFFVSSPSPICFVCFSQKGRIIVCSVDHPLEGWRMGRELGTCKQSGWGAGGESSDFESEWGIVDCSDRFCWTVLLDHWVQETITARVHVTTSLYLWPFHILLRSYVSHCFLCINFDSPPYLLERDGKWCYNNNMIT